MLPRKRQKQLKILQNYQKGEKIGVVLQLIEKMT